MPIIISGDPCLRGRLETAGVPIIDKQTAGRQDIRPARIGLLNLMPAAAMEATEIQWLRWIGGQALLQIEPVFIKFNKDKREQPGSSRAKILQRYTSFYEVAEIGLDGLIVTGDNLEIKQHIGLSSRDQVPFKDIRYNQQLTEVIDWSTENVSSTIYSCLAAHFALNYLHGLHREVSQKKSFGVYDHEILEPGSAFMRGMNDAMRSPHSRWGNTPVERIQSEHDLKILAISSEVGWLAIGRSNNAGGTDLFLQGHPEYDRLDLHKEYLRDQKGGLALPEHYYRGDEPVPENIRLTWSADAVVLHQNWIGQVYQVFSQPTQPPSQ